MLWRAARAQNMNYIENALTASDTLDFAVISQEDRGTKADFIQALRILGARVRKAFFLYQHGSAECHEIRVAVLSCRRRTWTMVFGTPANIMDRRDAMTNMPLQTWEHQCRDGKITCVGHLFDRVPDGPWVILARACLS